MSDKNIPLGSDQADTSIRYKGLLQAGSAFMGYAGVTLVGTLLGGILAVLNEVLIARFLGVDTYGDYAIGFMLARIGSIIAAFGMPVTVLHFLPVYLSRADKERALGSIISSVLLPLVGGVILALTLQSLSGWFAISVFGEPRAAAYIRNLAFLIPLIALTEVLGHIARGFGYALPYVVIRNLAPPICYMVVLLYLRHLGAPRIEVTNGFVGAYSLASLIGFLVILRFAWSLIVAARPRLQLRESYSYAVPVVLNGIVSLALFWTDLFQLGIFTNADTVGIYRACMQIVIAFDIIWTVYTAAVGPIFPVLLAENRLEQLRNTYLAAMHLATLLATPVFLLVVCNASDILGVLGPRFSTGAVAVSILAFGNLVKISVGVAAVLLILGGKQRLEAINAVVSAALNIGLNYYLIPRMGLMGASIATTTSLLVLSWMRLWQVSRAFPAVALDLRVFRVIPITVPLILFLYFAMTYFGYGQGTGVPHLLIRLILETTLLAAVIWRLCLSDEERQMLRGIMRRNKVTPVELTPPVVE